MDVAAGSDLAETGTTFPTSSAAESVTETLFSTQTRHPKTACGRAATHGCLYGPQTAAKTLGRVNASDSENDSILVFAEHPDRPLCDPSNTLWAYAIYKFKHTAPFAKSEADANELVNRLMQIALRAYADSVDAYHQLPEHAKVEQILRHVPLPLAQAVGLPSLCLKPTVSPGPPRRTKCFERGLLRSARRRSSFAAANALRPRFRFLRESEEPTGENRPASATAVIQTLAGLWPPEKATEARMSNHEADTRAHLAGSIVPQPRPTVHVRIDLLVSRKALEVSFVQNQSQQLAKLLYARMRGYEPLALIDARIGISDAKGRLVCRDVLFPVQMTSSAGAGTGSAQNMKASLKGPGAVERCSTPFPYLRLAPTRMQHIDETSLFICTPSNL